MIICRSMTKDDIAQVVEIEKQNFSVPWTWQGFSDWLSYDHTYLFVACDGDIVAGYAGACRAADEFDISGIAVREDYRKRGIAGMLVDEIINTAGRCGASAINLEVRESNRPAICLYEKKNFQKTGVRKKFYEKPVENAIIYRYQIPAE